MPNPTELIRLSGFRDELVKIASSGRLGAVAKRGVELLAGGKRADPGTISRLAARLKGIKVIGERTGSLKSLIFKGGDKREALKVLGAKTVAGAGGTAGAAEVVKGHRKTERKQLGRAYVAGARDMYGLSRRRAQQRY